MNIRAATTARRLLQLAVILILTACALPAVQAQPQIPACLGNAAAATDVNIVINNDLPKFNNKIPCSLGQGPQGDGDICLDINKKPDLKFNITGPNNPKWKFVEIQLSGDGENWPGELPLGAYSDFEFGSDAALQVGKPYARISGPDDKPGNLMQVRNNNCHQFQVYYRILLKNTVTNEYYYLHPIMDNRGSNN